MEEKICIISDTHFSMNNSLLFNYIDVEKNITILIDKINKEFPSRVFILGDISQDGTIESYIRAKYFLNKINCKKYILMGNHDSNNISTLLSDDILMLDYLDLGKHRFIFASSYKGNNCDDGHVTSAEMDKIRTLVNDTKLNYILIHHHFIQANGIIDTWIMDNYQEFSSFVNLLPLQAIFHGHVHNNYRTTYGNIDVFAAPSTCVQFGLTPLLNLEPFIGYQMLYLLKDTYDYKAIIEPIL